MTPILKTMEEFLCDDTKTAGVLFGDRATGQCHPCRPKPEYFSTAAQPSAQIAGGRAWNSLFRRDKRHLEITPAGKLLQERAQAILALLDETTGDIHALSTEKQITLRIATIGSVNNRLLPNLIARFSRDYFYVNFRVIEGRTEHVLEHVTSGDVDFGFVREPFNTSHFRSVLIHDPALAPGQSDHFVTIAQPQFYDAYYEGDSRDTIEIDELKDKPLIIHQRYREMILGACRKRGFNPYIICENDEIHSSLSWARAGIGIAIAPYTSAILSIDPGLVIRRLTFTAFIPWVRLVWNPSCQLSSEALAFMNMI